jgi:CheY-like chemotaxis protein
MFSGQTRSGWDLDTTPTAIPGRRPRALVLHGDPLALRVLRRSLEARSCTVVSAGDATSGLHLLLDELLDLDVLVTGLDLPHRDARSLAHLVRCAGGERDLAFVVVANGLAPELRAELFALGVDAIADLRNGEAAVAEAVLRVVAARRTLARADGFVGGAAPAA